MRLAKQSLGRSPGVTSAVAVLAMGFVACTAVLGVDELEFGECELDQVRCLSLSQPQSCTEDHHWKNIDACEDQTCVDGACKGICLQNSRRCDGVVPQRCASEGTGFANEGPCPFVCFEGECTGECKPKALSCAGNVPRVCNDKGKWENQAACVDKTCKAGECVGECEQGKKRCSGQTPQLCDANGQWNNNGAPCLSGLEVCEGGYCVESCTPGDLRCNGDYPQACQANGAWKNVTEEGCPPCLGCNPEIGKCYDSETTPISPGDVCEDEDPCTLVSRCDVNGNCVSKVKVECLAHKCSDAAPHCDVATGLCATLPDGSLCDDGNICTVDVQSTCSGGACQPGGDHSFAHWSLVSQLQSGERFSSIAYEEQNDPLSGAFAKDDVVLDHLTGLLWQRQIRPLDQELLTLSQAKDYCQNLQIAGYPAGAFRLPTRIELVSLLDYDKVKPAIDKMEFPWYSAVVANAREAFWTASPSLLPFPIARQWVVDFRQGYVFPEETVDHFLNVRCVH